jgi:hypothetical protein
MEISGFLTSITLNFKILAGFSRLFFKILAAFTGRRVA